MLLYKYLSPDRYDVLENNRIRFTQPSAFNDPFESSPYVETIIEKNKIDKFIDFIFNEGAKTSEEQYDQLIQQIAKEHSLPSEFVDIIKMFSRDQAMELARSVATPLFRDYLSLNLDDLREQVQQKIYSDLDSKFGMLCLTETPTNRKMWSHYADSHKGFLIGFNSDHPFFNTKRSSLDQIGFFRKVLYVEERPVIALYSPTGSEEDDVRRFAEVFFCTKEIAWKEENEWRMIQQLEKADVKYTDTGVYLFSYPTDAIDCVIIGAKSSDSLADKIINLLSSSSVYSHIKVKRAVLHPSKFEMHLENVD